MRKLLAIVLAVSVLFAFTACEPRIGLPEEGTALTAENFAASLEAGGQFYLAESLSVNHSEMLVISKDISIDLGGYTLNYSSSNCISIGNSSDVEIKNGDFDITLGTNTDSTLQGIQVVAGSSLTFDGVEYSSNKTGILVDDDNSKFTAIDSRIEAEGAYAVTTEATTPAPAGILITLNNSKVINNNSNPGLLFNIDGKLVVDNSTIEGGHQALIVRGGTADIRNKSRIKSRGDFSPSQDWMYVYDANRWGNGNMVAYSALVAGNAQTGSYVYPTIVTISSDSTVEMMINEGNKKASRIFIASANGEIANLVTENEEYISEIEESNRWIGETSQINGATLVESQT